MPVMPVKNLSKLFDGFVMWIVVVVSLSSAEIEEGLWGLSWWFSFTIWYVVIVVVVVVVCYCYHRHCGDNLLLIINPSQAFLSLLFVGCELVINYIGYQLLHIKPISTVIDPYNQWYASSLSKNYDQPVSNIFLDGSTNHKAYYGS